MYKIFEFNIPQNAVAIKSLNVTTETSGQMNLLMNYVGEYDQMSQNIIMSKKDQSKEEKRHQYEFYEKYDKNFKGLHNFISRPI